MKLLHIAMLLAVMQTSPPVPRKAADSANSTRQTVAKKAQDNKAPAAPSPTVLNPVTSAPEQNAANSPQRKNAEQSITVSKLPSVSVSRDWADWALWVFNGLLVFAGILGIHVAYKTLKKISEQTTATRDAAEATKRSVDLQEILNQQWVQVIGWRRHGGGSREQDPPRFRIAVDTSNPTNAPLTIIGATITAKGQTRTFIAGTTLGPNETPIIIETEEIVINPPEIAVYMAKRLPVVVTGEVVYRDMFGKDRVQTFGQLCILGPDNYFQNMPFYQMRMPETEETKSPENTEINPN